MCLHMACTALSADTTAAANPKAHLLLPQNQADYTNFLTGLLASQHKMLESLHGADSPKVALSSTLIDLQSTVNH